ncbi:MULTISPECIES: DUF5979 domain-containing protein [Kitasatospora]|uniref:DUF5979 domain-containing protein n=1 Tax=Kitasatospora setae (strain ATCC 33774 / DSM 43861 / JCM 3304 / KCC A-0304 / NBRC 14216 / KM-6054) TaxID=452652 RepID=E4N3G7_KITSK|nr:MULTISPECIES: DUF5979 domain-containing protein [Kitasatospora]BAJ32701.1 hypothetical protein KSE_69430 [Kitasatospora setae KM-6054]
MPRPPRSTLRAALGVLTAGGLLLGTFGTFGGALPTAFAADEQSAVSITKTDDLGGKPLQPGDEFVYTLNGQCSGLTVDCVHFTVTDTLPAEFEVTSLPQSTSTRDVTYDAATRQLTIVYKQALQNPAGETGLRAGQAGSVEVGMRLPADTDLKTGTVVTNTAAVDADNAAPQSADDDITVQIPLVVKPVGTKSWSDGSAVAGSGEESTLTLGVRNNSSSSAQVSRLTVSDTDQQTFEYFDFESATVTAFPAGADRATLVVTTADGATHTGDPITSPGPLPLPAGVDASQVTGFQVVFTNSAGTPLPTDPNGGSVTVRLKLRDTYRSTGQPLKPTDKITVDNCATPQAQEAASGTVNGADACAGYEILPDVLVVNATKKFFPDTNGDWSQQSGEHAVVGENSPVTAQVDAVNQSPFPIRTITVTEPSTLQPADFAELDVRQVRLRFPAGATSAALTVTYADGTTSTNTYTADTVVDVGKPGTTVAKVEVTYTGTDAAGNPTIAAGADAGLDLHGTLVPGVTAGPLTNCASFTADAGRADGSGTAAGQACQALTVEDPKSASGGSKSTDQTDVPPGQPIPMHLKVTNNGNVPMVNPVLTDPPAKPDGTPDFSQGTPFSVLRIDSITVNPSSAPVTVELWDPTTGSWVPYDAANTDLLHRATAVRVSYAGGLPPEGGYSIDLVTERRPEAGDGSSFQNCFNLTADSGYAAGSPVCSAGMTTGPAADAASLNKSISPGQLPQYVPGLARQHADVALTVLNTGNMSANLLRMTDQDADFFDAVDLVGITSNTMPAGADRVQVDAYVNGAWVNGTPAGNAALPAGVNPADVTGVRASYTSTSPANDGYTLTPCAATSCSGVLHLDVSPRPTLRSTGGPVPDHLEDTLSGAFSTKLEPAGQLAPIAPVTATLDLVKGTPELDVSKTPNTALAPGEDAPFQLKVTNTGTANVPDLVVKDDLPPGIAFLSTFQGDNGQPYRIIDVRLPDGTPPVPTPVFTQTTSGSRISGLTWDFAKNADGSAWVLAPGATFTIEIHVTLEAGMTADQVATNTMGATSSDPALVCDGTNQRDGAVFGTGLYCTATATLTAKSGAAFQARKWVSGNDALGWYDTRAKRGVPAGDASCLSTTDADGIRYTAAPCIALVNPGDRYHYLMRLQNAGTEAGTAMRIVDRLPVQGDTGVLLPQNRGTAWDNRPTLATEPKLTGPGTMTLAYEDTEPLCTDDLKMGGAGSTEAQCPAGTWDDPFSARVLGFRAELVFSPALAPGGTVDLTYAMDTPTKVTQDGDPTIAWNSYAHNETTQRAGSQRVLQANEPTQVGVATAYGSLTMRKTFGARPDRLGAALDRVPFPFHVVCRNTPAGLGLTTVLDQDYRVSANRPVTVGGIPAGSTCQVWETSARGGASEHPVGDPVGITITPGLGSESVQTVPIRNDFRFGGITLQKALTGEAARYAAGKTFTATVSCALPDAAGDASDLVLHQDYQVTADQPVTVTPLPVNSRCWAEEIDTAGAGQAVVDHGTADDPVTVTAGDPAGATITLTNTFPAGKLAVTKHVVNGGPGPYSFALACTTASGPVPLAAADSAFALSDGETREITVPDGAECTVTERDAPAGDTVGYSVADGRTTVAGRAAVEVTNTFALPSPTPTAAPTPTASPTGGDGGALPSTGTGWAPWASAAALLALLTGAALRLTARSRRH